MAKQANTDTITLYDKLVATNPGIERKGDTVPYTSSNGHMFSYINDGVVVLRLSTEDKEEFEQKYKTGPVISYGAVKKDYVSIPHELLKKTQELKQYFDRSLAYVNTLKPKPTKKK